jgi:chromosome segregation ATPase
MTTRNIKIGDKEFKVEDVTHEKKKLQDTISDIQNTIANVKEHSDKIHETCKTNNSIDATLKSTIESLQKEQDSSKKLLDDSAAFGKKETERADAFEKKLIESATRADALEKKSTDAETRADACEKEKKLTTTNSFDIIFKASQKTIDDAKKAIEDKKKLIVNESPLDDNIKEIYPNIESKDDEIVHTLKNTIDNLKILTEVKKIKILKQIYPKIQEYLKNWRSTFADAEDCEKKSKAKAVEEAKVAEAKAAEEAKVAAKAVEEANAAAKAAEEAKATVAEQKNDKTGGNRKSKEYLKYKKEYNKLKNQL